MNSVQTDPARLRGEALRRWYLRTPSQLQADRAAAADAAYDDFFNPPDRMSADDARPLRGSAMRPLTWTMTPNDGVKDLFYPADRISTDGSLPRAGQADSGHFRKVVMPEMSASQWTLRGCVICHGRQQPPPGAVGRVPEYSPFTRDGSGDGRRAPRKRDRKECDEQYDEDLEVCPRIPSAKARSDCWKQVNKRYGNCVASGVLDNPPLFPNGRPWLRPR